MIGDGFTVDIEELHAAAERIRQLADAIPSADVRLLREDRYGDVTLIDSGQDFASRWGRALTVLSGDLEGAASSMSSCATDYESTDGTVRASFDACAPLAMG